MQSFRRGPSGSIEPKLQFDASGARVHTRRLLLGGIAVLITVVRAHAAELPVKAKPVQYVKVCSLYGDGFYYLLGIEDGTFYARPIKDLNAAPPAGVIAGFGTFFPILASGGPTNSPWNNAGFVVPDIASNIRVDQSWGAAQVMGALHDDRARYYNATANGLLAGVAHPADAWGWAVGAGLQVNLPSQGDTFAAQAQYCRGWSGHCIINSSSRLADQTFGLVNSGTIGLAWVDDAFMANSPGTGGTVTFAPTGAAPTTFRVGTTGVISALVRLGA